MYAALRKAGIDPEVGLSYCMNDEVFYRSLLLEYAKGKEEKAGKLKTNLEAENWHDYAIDVHSLKSTSKMIGAMALFEKAAAIEKAANDNDGQTIRKGHQAMMDEYETVTSAIFSAISEEKAAEEDTDIMEFDPGDDDIMEFLPGEGGES